MEFEISAEFLCPQLIAWNIAWREVVEKLNRVYRANFFPHFDYSEFRSEIFEMLRCHGKRLKKIFRKRCYECKYWRNDLGCYCIDIEFAYSLCYHYSAEKFLREVMYYLCFENRRIRCESRLASHLLQLNFEDFSTMVPILERKFMCFDAKVEKYFGIAIQMGKFDHAKFIAENFYMEDCVLNGVRVKKHTLIKLLDKK